MQRAAVPEFDLASLAVTVDPGAYHRGAQYAQRRAVAQLRWEPSQSAMQGLVRGSDQFYTTIAYFAQYDGEPLVFEHGVCSCPVGADCKHVVALVLTAIRSGQGQREPATLQVVPAQPAAPAWETSLDELLKPDPASDAFRTPIAIELTLAATASRPAGRWQPAGGSGPKLTARLVQPGKADRWVAGSLNWTRLDSLSYHGNYLAEHVQVLRELYALYRSGTRPSHYGYGEERHIDLLGFESARLWPLLDAAESAGIRLIRARKLGDLESYARAELCLDVTTADSGVLTVSPALRIGQSPADALPVRFIGSQGHGLIYAPRADVARDSDCGTWRFGLARLASPVPPQLQRLALAGQRVEVPAADQARFGAEYYPRLRQAATVISSDDSFRPPSVSGPVLALLASYHDEHELDLAWEWRYQVDDDQLRFPGAGSAAPGKDTFRDTEAERRLLAGLDAPLEKFRLVKRGAAGRQLAAAQQLHGITTMRFSTELLPLLRDQPGLELEVSGEPADYREASDSVRIGVSASELTGDQDWFDLGITITVDGAGVPFTDVFVALSQGQSHLLLPGGAYFALDKPEFQALARLIEEARALQDAPPGQLRISRFQAGLWDELTELGVVDHQAAAWHRQVSGLLELGAVSEPEPPATLAARLRPYQLAGFGWLAFLWRHQLGGILADDMGLGKTLQSLALICHAKDESPAAGPFLIVAPTSVVPNWAAEAARFAPGLKVAVIRETGARRGADLGVSIAGADAVVTSYTLLRMDIDSYAAQDWSGLILDEAQFAKNHQSRVYQCARRVPAPVKIAITGTPMENNLMELWSLLSITAPGLFPSPAKFADYYAKPIERGEQPELLAQLRRRIRPLVTRRTKEQVAADLPAKQEQVLEVELDPRHREVYQTHLQRERQKILGLIDDMNGNRFTILRSLTLLRQLSLHAGLVDAEQSGLPSAKIDLLAGQLGDVIGGGHRALVFSQFTSFLRLVRDRLEADGVPYSYLDGSTRDRAAVIEQFTSGTAPVFLISLKAGGFGLNLTEADYCFLLDPWWNPATEAQAVDRAHRIGQTRNVMVYRLIAKDTIEEKVMALKARKAELFASVMDEGNVFGASLDADDIRGLFG